MLQLPLNNAREDDNNDALNYSNRRRLILDAPSFNDPSIISKVANC